MLFQKIIRVLSDMSRNIFNQLRSYCCRKFQIFEKMIRIKSTINKMTQWNWFSKLPSQLWMYFLHDTWNVTSFTCEWMKPEVDSWFEISPRLWESCCKHKLFAKMRWKRWKARRCIGFKSEPQMLESLFARKK